MAIKNPTSKIAVLGFSFLKSEKSFPVLRIRKVRAIDAGESTKLSLKNELKAIKNNPAA